MVYMLAFWESFSETLIYLLQNVALLFALVFLYAATNFNPQARELRKKIFIGLVVGGFAVLVMNFPWKLEEGIFYDARSILLSITGAFFGAIPTAIAGVIALMYRIYRGGDGVYAGSLTIITSSFLGMLFHFRSKLWLKKLPVFIKYYIFGLVVSITTVLCQLAIPWPKAFQAISAIWIPYLVFFPFVSAVLGVAIENQIQRVSSAKFLKQQQVLLQASIDSPKEMEIFAVSMNYNYLSFNRFHEASIKKYYELPIKVDQNFLDNISDDKMAYRIKTCFDKALNGDSFMRIDEVETQKGKFLENFYAPIYDEHHKIMGVTVFSHDISDRKKYEQSILYLSYHDVLTGLKNRRYYSEELLRINGEEFYPISIIMGDINGLKIMNDAFGHDSGDELLKIVATELKETFSAKGEVARIGGDEFVVILVNTSKGEATSLIERVKKQIEKHILNGMHVSVSFGVEAKVDSLPIDEVVRIAEDDMYKHKLFEITSNKNEAIKAILDTLNMKNPHEEKHSRRVSHYCFKIGQILGMREDELSILKLIGNLHDIGKIAIDESILNKQGELTDEEWTQMRRHPEIGYRIISSSPEYSEISEDILSHHERWDGKGYPQGLVGKDIPFRARIIAIADAYDAMTSSKRTYRKKFTKSEALEEIKRCSGTQFDPIIAMKFVESLKNNNDDQ